MNNGSAFRSRVVVLFAAMLFGCSESALDSMGDAQDAALRADVPESATDTEPAPNDTEPTPTDTEPTPTDTGHCLGDACGPPVGCGNGVIDHGEDCDAFALGDATCATLGFADGRLACAADCSFDTAACTGCTQDAQCLTPAHPKVLAAGTCCGCGAVCRDGQCGSDCVQADCCAESGCDAACENLTPFCGNGAREGNEPCDDDDLGDTTCESLGLPVGVLACAPDCALDTDGCKVCDKPIAVDPQNCGGCDIVCASDHVGGKSTLVSLENVLTTLTGDFDGDGNADVAMLAGAPTTTARGVRVSFGDGHGQFAPAPLFEITNAGRTYPRWGSSIVVADVDADTRDDLIAFDTVDLQVLRSMGDGTFAVTPYAVDGGARVYGVSAADFDGDSDIDFVAESASGGLWFFAGDGAGTFAAAVAAAPGVGASGAIGSLRAADFDGDQVLDLVAVCDADMYCNRYAVFLGNGDGTFDAALTNYGFAGSNWMTGIAVGDVDEDGHEDIVAGRYNYSLGQPLVGFLAGRGDGTFTARALSIVDPTCGTWPGTSQGGPLLADFDQDGHLDVVVACTSGGGGRVFRGDGDWTFQASLGFRFDYTYYGPVLALGEFDGDGRLDIVLSMFNYVRLGLGRRDGAFEFVAGQHGTCTAGLCVKQCDPGWDDCNGNVQTDGCETDVRYVADHCGGCTNVCSSQHVVAPNCSEGVCNGTCVSGYADCNHDKLRDGCEATLASDTQNCKTCGTVCALPHAVQSCREGVCAIGSCQDGWADCDKNAANGCEIDTTSDPLHCAVCDHACEFGTGCVQSVCVAGCSTGRKDCDDELANGCEAILATDSDNCGDCGIACSDHHINGVLNLALGTTATAYAAAAGDFTGDGKADLALRSYSNGQYQLVVDVGDGHAVFTPLAPITPLGSGYSKHTSGLRAADFDADGRDDLLAAFPNDAALLRSLGDGGFSVGALPIPAGAVLRQTAVGEFDGDRVLDFIGATDTDLRLYPGRGNATFGADGALLAGDGPVATLGLTAADYNGDGALDVVGLAAAVNRLSAITLWLGDGHGGFLAPSAIGTQEAAVLLVGGAFNEDGRPDLAVMHLPIGSTNFAPESLALLLNAGAGSFTKTADFYTGYFDYVVVADFDGVQGDDFFLSDTFAGGLTLVNRGDGTFGPFRAQAVSGSAGVAADLDGDGRTDLALCYGSVFPAGVGIGAFAIGLGDVRGDLDFYRGQGVCSAAGCTGTCDATWRDCNDDLQSDGCETSTVSDPDHCGACGTVYSTFGLVGAGCANGVCRGTCQAGHLDRDRNIQSNGCEGILEAPILDGPVPAVGSTGGVLTLLGQRFSTLPGELRGIFTGNGASNSDVVTVTSDTSGTIRLPHAAGTYTLTLQQAGLVSEPLLVHVAPDGPSNVVAAGDFDDDGEADLALATGGDETIGVLLGNGDGTLQTEQTRAVDAAPTAISVGDFDGDALPDVAVLSQRADLATVFLGNGDGTLAAGIPFATGRRPMALVAADLDGDGHLDLAVTHFVDDAVGLFLGHGDGTFADPVFVAAPAGPAGVASADFDGDGDADLAVAGCGTLELAILVNAGDGSFASGARWALGARFRRNPVAIAAVDVDGHGTVDLLVGGDRIELYAGAGDGTFTLAADLATRGYALEVRDLDGDGLRDLVAIGSDARVLAQRPDGTFAAAIGHAVGDGPGSVGVADYNADGRPDLVVGNINTAKFTLLLSSPSGLGTPGTLPSDGALVALGDLDGDGALDLVVAANTTLSVQRGDGQGHFGAPVRYAKPTGLRRLVVDDIDADGDLDCVVLDQATVDVFLGHGDGTLQPFVSTATGSPAATFFASGHLDDDGKPDLVLWSSQRVSLLGGRGDGTFDPATPIMHVDNQSPQGELAFVNHNSLQGMKLADLDGNGKTDILLSVAQSTPYDNWSSGRLLLFVLYRDGNRHFDLSGIVSADESPAAAGGYVLPGGSSDIAVADLDGDQALDVAAGGTILLGIPGALGTDAALEVTPVTFTGRGTLLVEVSGDGVLDLIAVTGNSVRIYPGLGDGTLGALRTFAAGYTARSVAAGDLDGNGTADLVVGSTGTGSGATVTVLLRP